MGLKEVNNSLEQLDLKVDLQTGLKFTVALEFVMAETVFNSHQNISEKESQYLPLIRLISYGHEEVLDLQDIVQTGFIFDFLHRFDPIHFGKIIWSQVKGFL